MASIAFICPPLAGHINPMASLAREFVRRGHRVTFLGFPDMESRLPRDLKFAAFGAADRPVGSLQPYFDRLSKIGSMLSVTRLVRDLAGFTDITCRELPRLLDRLAPDALIVDQTDSAASLVTNATGAKFANVANALPFNAEPRIPPPVLPWAYDPSPRGVGRNRGGYRVMRLIERPITKTLRRHARRFGRPDIRFADDTWSDLCQLTQCVEALDFPREQLPAHFHYVGPLRDPHRPEPLDLAEDGRPMVYCSFGTLQGSRIERFRAVAQAAADLDLNLLIAHGGMLSPGEIATLPGKPQVREFVPQQVVLQRAAAAVTHAGFNTVMDALASATPMVAMPIGFEQPATGARLQHAGVGEMLMRPTAERIRTAMHKVLTDDGYVRNAERLADEIGRAGGVRRAADLLERSLGLCARAAGPTMERRASDGARGDSRNESR